jgi:hypothetical protein
MASPKFMTLEELTAALPKLEEQVYYLKASAECEGANYRHFSYEATLGEQLYQANRNLEAVKFYIKHWDINNPA